MLTIRFIYFTGRIVDISKRVDEQYAQYLLDMIHESMAAGEQQAADRDAYERQEWADQIKYENKNMGIS